MTATSETQRRLGHLVLLVLLAGCSKSTPVVTTGPHHNESDPGVFVDALPPPAKVEILPVQRREDCRWKDGYWDYRGHTWHWVKGAWVLPPPDCYYAVPATRFEVTELGRTLVYRRGAWYADAPGGAVCADAERCPSASSTNDDGE